MACLGWTALVPTGPVGATPATAPPAAAELKAGGLLQLPAGTVSLADFVIPDGATIRGAGWEKTIIDAEGARAGLIAASGSGITIADLTIRNAAETGIRISDVAGAMLERVRVTGASVGVSVAGSRDVLVSNCIVDNGPAGLSCQDVQGMAVVNCTFARIGTSCVGLTGAVDTAVFNTVLADASTAIVLGPRNERLTIDHNLHACFSAGKTVGQLPRSSLPTWRSLTGHDRRSVATGVRFADVAAGDFRPVARLEWQPWRVTTADWGVAELAGVKAPAADIAGRPRSGAIDLGACEPPPDAAAGDGSFEIAADAGLKSAGVFTPDGRLVRYLFHDLPLASGRHEFRLAGRTQLGEPVPAGPYEVRLVEADLGIEYRGLAGNLGRSNDPLDANCLSLAHVAWAADGSLLLCNGWSEKHMSLVRLDLGAGRGTWSFKGSVDVFGIAADGRGTCFLVRRAGPHGQPLTFDVVRIGESDGLPRGSEAGGRPTVFPGLSPSPYLSGAAVLDGRLYVADPLAGQVLVIDATTLRPLAPFRLPGAASPAADAERGLIWVVSQGRVVAVDPDGVVRHDHLLAPEPLAVAVAGATLAVADAESGQVLLHDITDPGQPQLRGRIGSGDGPFGPWQADRFDFRRTPRHPQPACRLALRPDGTLAVLGGRFGRLAVFRPDGEVAYEAAAHFGNGPVLPAWRGKETTIFENGGRMSFWIDTLAGTTGLGGHWDVPDGAAGMVGGFEADGRRFAVFRRRRPAPDNREGVLVCRAEADHRFRPLALYEEEAPAAATWRVRRDTNADAVIDDADAPGDPVPFIAAPITRWMSVTPDGDIVSTGAAQLGTVMRFAGLDPAGVPIHEVGPELVLRRRVDEITNPYDFGKRTPIGQSETLVMPDGQGTAVAAVLRDTPLGMGLSNSGATDVARFAADGTLLWLRPMNEHSPIQGIKPLGWGLLTGYGHEAWWLMLLSNDGLGMGGFGPPAAFHWHGYWLDHPDHSTAFVGPDGRTHVLAGDYSVNGVHWLSVTGAETVRHARQPLVIDERLAAALATRPAEPFTGSPKPPPPRLVVRKLADPLPMDGDLAKWRQAVPSPQVLITPATSTGGIDSPADMSATVRLARHGGTLYFQFLVFDDAVAQHQGADKFYLQDSVQLTINGFMSGFAFNAARLADGTDLLFRNRFLTGNLDLAVDPGVAPRNYQVLPDARDVEERGLIESIDGTDLARSSVRAYEFAIPLDERAYPDAAAGGLVPESGREFWIGFLLNDVDTVGVDEQPHAVWPSTFNMFSMPERGAIAVFE